MDKLATRNYDIAFVIVLVLLTLFHVFLILYNPFDLSADEAYYWVWSRNIDWAYYSKGPVIAWLILMGTELFGDTALAVRFPALLCLSLLSISLYLFVRRNYSAKEAFWSTLALRITPIFYSQGFLMTTDPPTALCWFLAVWCFFNAVVRSMSRWWVPGFALVGLGVLAKYTVGILYPSVFIFLLFSKDLRFHLRKVSFWVGTLIMGLIISPVLIWNVKNGWVNFQHNATHLSSNSHVLKPVFLLELIGGQFVLIGPVLFVCMIWAVVVGWKQWRQGDREAGLFMWTMLPLVALCLVVSLTRRIYANWPMPLYLSGMLLLVHLVSQSNLFKNKIKNIKQAHFLVNGLLCILLTLLVMGMTFGINGKKLTTKKLSGWKGLAEQTRIILESKKSPPKPFIMANNYDTAATLSFYLPNHPDVMCASVKNRRMNQYDIWGGWEKYKGRNALIVVRYEEQIEDMRTWFKRIEKINNPEMYNVVYGDELIWQAFFYKGYEYSGESQPLPSAR